MLADVLCRRDDPVGILINLPLRYIQIRGLSTRNQHFYAVYLITVSDSREETSVFRIGTANISIHGNDLSLRCLYKQV